MYAGKKAGTTAIIIFALITAPASAKTKAKKDNSADTRAAYIQKVQQATAAQPTSSSVGSLWSPAAPLAEVASDFKATRLNDTVVIQVVEQTSAASNQNSAQQRTLAASSAVPGVAGQTFTSLNPILSVSSSHQLKGQGQIAANSQLQTSLTGQVVSVLPNGNLVVEAQRETSINGQRETMVVRGVARPGDIGFGNHILSTSLMDLEVELKGKGLVSDATRGPNPVTRTLMWLLGF